MTAKRDRIRIVALVTLGLLIACSFVFLTRDLQSERLRAGFEAKVKNRIASLNEAVRASVHEMESLDAFFEASKEVTREEFAIFGSVLLENANALQTISWIPRVRHEDRAAFEAERSGFTSAPFTLGEKGPDGKEMVPAGAREEYYPVDFIVPWTGNEPAFGFDLASDPVRRQALERSRDTGEMSATEPIHLVQNPDTGAAVLMIKPLYRKGMPARTTPERRAALSGFLTGIFMVEEIVRGAMDRIADDGIQLQLRYACAGNDTRYVYSLPPGVPGRESDITRTISFQIVDQDWTATFSKDYAFHDHQQTRSAILLSGGGILVVLSLGLLIRKSHRHASEAEKAQGELTVVVNQKEAALREADLLDEIVEKIDLGNSLFEILDYIYKGFATIMPYDRIGFALIEGEPKMVRSLWCRTSYGESSLGEGYKAPLLGSSLEEVARTGIPRIINDLRRYYGEKPSSESTRLILKDEMRSSLTCPLVAMGEPVGFLFFSHRNSDTYSKDHAKAFMRIASHVSRIVEKGILFDSLKHEQNKSEKLLTSILPAPIVSRLKNRPAYLADKIEDATIVFADIVDFSAWGESCEPEKMVEQLSEIFEIFDAIARNCKVQKICTHGDLYLAAGGLPFPCEEHARNVADFSLAIRDTIEGFTGYDGKKLRLRIGIHTGPVVAGVTGTWAFRYDVWGSTVNLASRLESSSEPGKIQVSESTFRHLSDAYHLTRHGRVYLKGFGETATYWLDGRRPIAPREAGRQPKSALIE